MYDFRQRHEHVGFAVDLNKYFSIKVSFIAAVTSYCTDKLFQLVNSQFCFYFDAAFLLLSTLDRDHLQALYLLL
jgi:hypothetical protein